MKYAFRFLMHQPFRLFITIGGTTLCVVLMLFLFSIYRGVADGSVEYIRKSNTDLWVLQRNVTNILRGTSILSTAHGTVLETVPQIESVSPVLFILSTIKKEDMSATAFLTGFDMKRGIGGPPCITKGRSITADDEIVLDKSFALKYNCKLGERVVVQDDTLRIVGLSKGTNAFVIQYAFVSLHRAHTIIGYPGLVSCFLIKVKQGKSIAETISTIREEVPGTDVYDHATFLQNNIKEMESGFLPLLYTIAAIGGVVLTIILTLLLTINIIERRKDFAAMKILGAPRGFLPGIITWQAILIIIVSFIIALILFFIMVEIVEAISPEISTKTSLTQIGLTFILATILGFLSALFSMRRLRHIYPLEVYQ
jgi:ABC-type antimicrobial peptide transport system permease subunit